MYLLVSRSGVMMKKVPNNGVPKRTGLGHLPKRSAVNIEFNNVSYSVSEGRRKGTVYTKVAVYQSLEEYTTYHNHCLNDML